MTARRQAPGKTPLRRRGGSWTPETRPDTPGRTSTLDRTVALLDGTTAPISEAIPATMRATGCTWDEAALRFGIAYTTIAGWLTLAGSVRRRLALIPPDAPPDQANPFTPHELACLAFSDATESAAADVIIRWQQILETEGRGGYEITTTTTKELVDKETGEPTGIVERTTKIEHARPDTQVIRWRMGKMLPRYRDRPAVEVNIDQAGSVHVAGPSEAELAGEMAETFRQFQRQAIEATAEDVANTDTAPGGVPYTDAAPEDEVRRDPDPPVAPRVRRSRAPRRGQGSDGPPVVG